MTHCSVDCEKPRSLAIEGSATLTIETSRTTMKNAAQTSARARQRRGSGSQRGLHRAGGYKGRPGYTWAASVVRWGPR